MTPEPCYAATSPDVTARVSIKFYLSDHIGGGLLSALLSTRYLLSIPSSKLSFLAISVYMVEYVQKGGHRKIMNHDDKK